MEYQKINKIQWEHSSTISGFEIATLYKIVTMGIIKINKDSILSLINRAIMKLLPEALLKVYKYFFQTKKMKNKQ